MSQKYLDVSNFTGYTEKVKEIYGQTGISGAKKIVEETEERTRHMVIVGLALLIVLVVCGIHSWTQKDAPREPFYLDIEGEEE